MPCTLSAKIAESPGVSVLAKSEKDAAFLYYLAQTLVGSGGANYTDINALRQAVACWCVGGQTLDSFRARVAINAAVQSGAVATQPTTAAIRNNIRCWQCGIGGDERRAMEAFLLCQILEAIVT